MQVPERENEDQSNGEDDADLVTSEHWITVSCRDWLHSLFNLSFESKIIKKKTEKENEKQKQREIIGRLLCLCFFCWLLKKWFKIREGLLLVWWFFVCFSRLFLPFLFSFSRRKLPVLPFRSRSVGDWVPPSKEVFFYFCTPPPTPICYCWLYLG